MRERAAAHHLTYRAAHYGLGEDDPSIIEWRRGRPVSTGNDVPTFIRKYDNTFS